MSDVHTTGSVDGATAAATADDLGVYNGHLRDQTRHADTKAGQGIALVLLAATTAAVVMPRLNRGALVAAVLTLAVVLAAGVVFTTVYLPRGVLIGHRSAKEITTEALARVRDPHRKLAAAAMESARLEAILWIKHRRIAIGLFLLGAAMIGVIATAAMGGIATWMG
jgi:hypothetical protein